MSRLTDSVRQSGPGDPTLSEAPQASPQQVPAGEPMADVFLTTAVRTSAGPGPGHFRLPAAEANLLISRRHAVGGSEPPRGFAGTPEPSTKPFDDNHNPHGSRHDDGLRR